MCHLLNESQHMICCPLSSPPFSFLSLCCCSPIILMESLSCCLPVSMVTKNGLYLVWFTFHHYHSLTHSNMRTYTLAVTNPQNMKCENCECAKRTTLNIHTNTFDVTLWLATYPSRPKTGASILNLTLNRFPKPLKSNLSPFPNFPTSILSSRSQT